MPLLKTRFFKPIVSKGYLARNNLLNKMLDNHYKPVQLVIAPAGYGKSVFVSQCGKTGLFDHPSSVLKTNHTYFD